MTSTSDNPLVMPAPAAPLPPDEPIPSDLNELDRRLHAYAHAGKHADAYALLLRVRDHTPDNLKVRARVPRYAVAAGKLAEAEAVARLVLGQSDGDPWCYLVLAHAARRRGDLAQALALADQGLAMPGTFSGLHMERAQILLAQRQPEAAALAFEAALNLDPGNWQAQHRLAELLHARGDTARCRALCDAAMARCPDSESAWLRLSKLLQSVSRLDDALHACDRAATLAPTRGGAHVNRGAILRRLQRFDDALDAYDRALALDPKSAAAHFNRANLLKFLGRLDEAIHDYGETLAREPQNGTAHWNLARALLTQGELADGFREYEWRWRHPGFPTRLRNFPQPAWTGEALQGKTLFVHAEQGHGDLILFLRFLPQVRALGAKIVLEVHKELYALVAAQGMADVLVHYGNAPPAFDLHVPVGSLAHRLGTTARDLPATPYLRVQPDAASALPPRSGRARVGLVWAGNPKYAGDAARSMHFNQVRPLLTQLDIAWYALQKGPAEAQLPGSMPITPLGPTLRDWNITAQVLNQLDLVITTCTGVANLAGAMGRPVWIMLEWDADWRWPARSQERSLWYPHARLFRQQTPGDWAGVVRQVGQALREHRAD